MAANKSSNLNATTPEFLSGGGEMGQRIRDFNWAETSLGPVEYWPQNLRTCIRIMLASRQPIWIGWGHELIKFYNDAYKSIVGGKHPWALGKPASVVWSDIWHDIDPMLNKVMEQDEGTYVESQLLIMERNGYAEETYYTFSYTPIPGDDGITAGMICANTDDTERIIGERNLKTLTELSKNLANSKTKDDVIEHTLITLKNNAYDFPFCAFYSNKSDKLNLYTRIEPTVELQEFPLIIDPGANDSLSVLICETLSKGTMSILKDPTSILKNLSMGPWKEQSKIALIIPVTQNASADPYGVLILGFNPHRLYDEKAASFISLIIDKVSTSLADIDALEMEKKRVEALAALDKAKTTFFSNISHEFRTPLTLLLGPLDETMEDPEISQDNLNRLKIAKRNAFRLQRLVNSLLDFSSIEAGKLIGKFQKVDIAALTADLVSNFRSAIEKAGMELIVKTENITQEVYVDVEMWERIIINLLSNALKYSDKGKITAAVVERGNEIEVSISDTGIGIPQDQIDKVFNRFHRIENNEGRSKEGTGIGLAMVKELVKLNGGKIKLNSDLGVGSTFNITLLTGKDHLDPSRILEISGIKINENLLTGFLEEASGWSVKSKKPSLLNSDSSDNMANRKHTVLLADDNADMRAYIEKILRKEFNVVTVNNGEEAYDTANRIFPDLILSDIMMPKLDGMGLLKKLRENSLTKHIPIILLSAKAGEEAKVEGIEAGADDYLVKPFSSRELIARVEGNIKINKSRLTAENNLKNVIQQSPVAMTILRGKEFIIDIANERALELWGKPKDKVMNKPAFEVFPELVEQGFDKILNGVFAEGKPFLANEMPVELIRNDQPQTLYINFIYEPLIDDNSTVQGIIGVGIDVTEQVNARLIIEQAEATSRLAIQSAHLGTYEIDLLSDKIYTSPRFKEIWGVKSEIQRNEYTSYIHPEDLDQRLTAHERSITTGDLFYEARVIWEDNSVHWIKVNGKVLYNFSGEPITLLGVIQDITSEKLYTESLNQRIQESTMELQRSNQDLQQFAHVASHDLKEPVRKIKTYISRISEEYAELLPEKAKTFVKKIERSSERMSSMIDGILDYSTVNTEQAQEENVDLNLLLSDIESDLELTIEKKNAIITRGQLPVIKGMKILLYQLFNNLISNSLKFCKEDVTPAIDISAVPEHEEDKFIEIKLTDNGIGFRPEMSESIFNTFTRLNSKDKYEGTGLGLALCKRIVERHNGSIHAISNGNEGATFILRFPLLNN